MYICSSRCANTAAISPPPPPPAGKPSTSPGRIWRRAAALAASHRHHLLLLRPLPALPPKPNRIHPARCVAVLQPHHTVTPRAAAGRCPCRHPPHPLLQWPTAAPATSPSPLAPMQPPSCRRRRRRRPASRAPVLVGSGAVLLLQPPATATICPRNQTEHTHHSTFRHEEERKKQPSGAAAGVAVLWPHRSHRELPQATVEASIWAAAAAEPSRPSRPTEKIAGMCKLHCSSPHGPLHTLPPSRMLHRTYQDVC